MNHIRTLFLLIALTSVSANYSQQRRFGHYGLAEGLPQETILCLTEDEKGFYWLGTSDGIVRFDGHDFYVPQPDINSGLDVAGYRIGAILAKDETIYVGTGQHGLIAYNIKDESTTQLLDSDSNCTRIISNNSQIIAAYYNKGIAIIESGKSKYLQFNIENPKEIIGLSIFKNDVYLATKTGDIYSFLLEDITTQKVIQLNKIANTSNAVTNIVSIEEQLFICTTSGIFTLNNTTKTLNKITSQDTAVNLNLTINTIKKINEIYFIGSNNGLLTAQLIDGKFRINAQYQANKKDPLNTVSFDNINDLHNDNKGNLLIGSFNLEITTISEEAVFKNPTTLFNVNDPSVFAVVDTEDYLFTATSSGLVISDNKDHSKFKLFPGYRARGFAKDDYNNIWLATGVGTYILNMDTFNIENPNFIKLPAKTDNPSHLPSNNIRSIYKDLHSTIWVTSYSDGFSKFVGNVAKQEFDFINYSTATMPSRLTISMIEDSKGIYWMTTQKGLSAFNFKGDTFNLIKNYDETHGLATRGVLSVFEDSDNTLWIATRKGLSKYNRESDTFISFGKRDGLSNTFIYNINEDDLNNIWLSTNGGLFRFNKKTEEFTNYNPKDGVQSTEFNLGAVYKNKANGFLYFGGINGVSIFDPKQIDSLDKEGQLSFTELKVKDKVVLPSQSSILATSIINAESINVNYNDFPIDLSFSGLDYSLNSNVKYVYKLLPDDDNWNDLGYKNSIQLLNLAPKDYTLLIQGKSRNSLWQKPPLKIAINVKPPWYRSNLAYALYLLLFLGIIYAFYRISLQRQIAGQESKRLQDLDDLKSRFITNITHEFRTPLTIILGYVDSLKSKLTDKNSEKEDLKTIEQNSENLLGLVNQMLDLAKLEQGRLDIAYTKADVSKFTNYVTQSFESLAEDKEVALWYISKIEDPILDFDAEKLRQILTNLVSNAIKFTEKGQKVTVTLSEINAKYQITVADTGAGIPEKDVAQIFDRFYQVQNNSFKVSQGTGIGLALTKELVQLLNGTITAQSKLGEGTTFRVQIPITRIAIDKDVAASISTIANQGIQVPAAKSVVIDQDAPTVLIVEDNKDMSRYISSCLQGSFKVTTTFNGQKGFDKATKETPDIIISDVMMPVMDGFEMTQKLQSQEATNHIPIVLLTSKALQEDKLEGLESGADAYLTKPFQKAELLLRIHKLIEKRKTLQKRYQIATVLLEKKQDKKPIADKNILFLNKAISSIHDNLADTSFNSEMLSRELALSDSQLYRKLKAITNTSTAIFIRKVRLEKAKELLETTTKNVSEIAYETGFNDPNWFGKVFKETFDVSPSQIRK